MTRLLWDQIGSRKFVSGCDRGVLYLRGQSPVVWNGLISVDEQIGQTATSAFFDGVKYAEIPQVGDFSAKLKAYTYPDLFDICLGIGATGYGVSVYEQNAKPFSLCYRTLKGNDIDGTDHGYVLHILYDVIVQPDVVNITSLSASTAASEMGFLLRGTPQILDGMRPTWHITVDSTVVDPDKLSELEDILYGSDISEATLPTAQEVFNIINPDYSGTVILGRLDGTWTAHDSGDNITMLSPTEFEIDPVNATYSDEDTFTVETTP